MKLFFFGGTFDPPHNGHLAIIDYCMKLCDKLIVLPSKIPEINFLLFDILKILGMGHLGIYDSSLCTALGDNDIFP